MRWFSRLHRQPAHPFVAVTLLPSPRREFTLSDQTWEAVFSTLDQRGIPATWAVNEGDTPRVAKRIIASRNPHELALLSGQNRLSELMDAFARQRSLAQVAHVPLRCLLSQNVRVHPSLLKQLGVVVVVPASFKAFSRTGLLRGLAWNTWEARPTDRGALPFTQNDLTRLSTRLAKAMRQSTRLHLVLELGSAIHQSELEELASWLDVVSDFAQRGWLKLETVGQQADELAQSMSADDTSLRAA